jgi:hypothetical protein
MSEHAPKDPAHMQQYLAEIDAGLRWPDGRPVDYERDDYFRQHPLALTLPKELRRG